MNTIQRSDCCRAPINLNPKLERPECYTCSKCGRVIGTPIQNKPTALPNEIYTEAPKTDWTNNIIVGIAVGI